MKKFLVKVSAFFLIIAGFIYVYISFLADNYTDPYYDRFTTGRYKSLVLGTSRAAQGIEPSVLNRMLGLGDNKIYNYSFTAGRSIWGEPYFNSIKRKLHRTKEQDGIFILECNPWAMYSKVGQVGKFVEKGAAPNNIRLPNVHPNIEYFFGGYEYSNFRLLIKKLFGKDDKTFVNEFGRFVVDYPFDSTKIPDRIKWRIDAYKEMTRDHVPDSSRAYYFEKTIKYLQQYGAVYLVRMPVAKEMAELEASFFRDYNKELNAISAELSVPYLDFTYLSNKYVVADGNHIHNKYVISFTELLSSKILEHQYKVESKK